MLGMSRQLEATSPWPDSSGSPPPCTDGPYVLITSFAGPLDQDSEAGNALGGLLVPEPMAVGVALPPSCSGPLGSVNADWGVKIVLPTAFDTSPMTQLDWGFQSLRDTVMHELGHALGLGHPSFGFPAVMAHAPGATLCGGDVDATGYMEELTQNDIVCAETVDGFRNLAGRLTDTATGEASDPVGLQGTAAIGGGLADLTPFLWVPAAATVSGSCLGLWLDVPAEYGGPTYEPFGCDPADPPAIGLRTVVPAEDPAVLRVLFSDTADGPAVSVTATEAVPGHVVQAVDPADPGPGPFGSRPVLACPQGHSGCSDIESPYGLAWAWAPQGHTITAWVTYPGAKGYERHPLHIGAGFFPHAASQGRDVITPTFDLQATSIVAPAVACGRPGSSEQECLLAYVPDPPDVCGYPAQGRSGHVVVQRFHIQYLTGNAALGLDGTPTVLGPSAGSAAALAAWYNSEQHLYFLAFRADDGAVEIWSSFDANTWVPAQVAISSLRSTSGPTAASYFNGTSNVLYSAR